MKKLKTPTIGILMATLVFSNIQLCSIYGYETGDIGENVNTNIVQNNDTNIKDIKSYDKKEIINIPDINFKKAINSILGKDENSDITRVELESIDELGGLEDIKSLEGIQYCVNLNRLALANNDNISDISPLSGLINLESLVLGSEKISDISPLSELTNLKHLRLNSMKISDINVLSGLINLKTLDLTNTNISDISVLSRLTNLRNLELGRNKISDISSLSKLTNLKDLYLYENEISDISALSGLNNLEYLSLDYNKISDISELSELTKLWNLGLSDNDISDISPLSKMIDLEDLHLSNNKISDINVLSKLTKISNLNLDNNKISDITPLLNLNGEHDWSNIYLSNNLLDLKNSKTMEVIKYLEHRGYEVYYDNQLTQIPPVQSPNKFNDIKDHWAQKQIDSFISSGYINGYSDGTFKPNNSITRAEFVTIVNNYFGLTKGSGKVFSDTKNHWAKSAIDIAVTNGVCNGISSTEFKPNDPITREQASVMISNYKKLSDSNLDKLKNYKDASKVSSWAKASVEGMIEKGYMGGYSDNTFKPKSKITRAEAVVTLSRITK